MSVFQISSVQETLIQQLNAPNKFVEGFSGLYSYGKTLLQSVNDRTQALEVLGDLLVVLKDPDSAGANQDLLDDLDGFESCTFNNLDRLIGLDVSVLSTEQALPVVTLTISERINGVMVTIGTWVRDSLGAFSLTLNSMYRDITGVVSDVASSIGITSSLGSILTHAGSSGIDFTDGVQNFKSLVSSLLSNATGIPKQLKDTLYAATQQGVSGLLDGVRNLLTSDSVSTEVGATSALNSRTDIIFNQIAPGLILQGIGAVTTIAGAIVACFGGIVGLVIHAIGTAVTIASKLVTNAAQAYSGCKFTLHADGDHMFDFIVDRFNVRDSDTVAYTALKEAMSTELAPNPCVINVVNRGICFVVYDNGEYFEVEARLSTDYDLFQVTSPTVGLFDVTNQAVPSGNNLILRVPALFNDTSFAMSGITRAPSGGYFYSYSHGTITEGDASHPDFTQVGANAYHPISYRAIDSIVNVFSDGPSLAAYRRLVSALYIWSGCVLVNMGCFPARMPPRYLDDPMAAADYLIVLGFPTAQSGVSPVNLCSLHSTCLRAIFSYYCEAASAGFKLRDDPAIDTNAWDAVLSNIQTCFNGLPLIDQVQKNTKPWIFRSSHWYQGDWAVVDTPTSSGANSVTYRRIYPVAPVILSDATSLVGVCGIALPENFFSAFLLGILVEAAIVLAGVAAAVGITIGRLAVINLRSRLQAKVESAWYNYQDDSGSWKDYKNARLKYNLLAMATGGTTMSLGLYDEVDASEPASEDSLQDVIALIAG